MKEICGIRRTGTSQTTAYSTMKQRSNLWHELIPQGPKEKHRKKSFTGRKPLEPEITETSKIMKTDIHSRICPWISTTHREMYGQCYTTTSVKGTSLKEKFKKSKPENMHRLICSINHIPVTRMDCYNHGHFRTTYTNDFVDFDLPDKEKKMHLPDYNLHGKIENPAVPYGSKNWTTSYRYDYGLLPKLQSSEAVVPIAKEIISIPTVEKISPIIQSSYLHSKSDWSTSYQEYGLSKQGNLITTTPYPDVLGSTTQITAELTSNVAKLMRY